MRPGLISINNLADIAGVSRATVENWIGKGRLSTVLDSNGKSMILLSSATHIPEVCSMLNSRWEEEMHIESNHVYTAIELFAGAGGLALGFEKAGLKHVLLNELNHHACETLRQNRPDWKILETDVHEIDFSPLRNRIDVVSGGFPCQAFSYAGKRLGFEETRGTLFFEMARTISEVQPLVFIGENVRGLLEHDNGRTLETIRNVIADLGYTLVEPKILRAIFYNVPQKRERLFLIGIRNDVAQYVTFRWPDVCGQIRTLRDAFHKGDLYPCDVPPSEGQEYPSAKKEVLDHVPEGGDWRNLPEKIAREYMKGSYNLGGGKTGMARRLSMDEPSLTLTCAPAQKQTERCHPTETRPLTVREYARIQTFPDDWTFCGNLTEKYKQIGNAVPVNLAWAVGRSIIRLLNDIYDLPRISKPGKDATINPYVKWHGLFEGCACDRKENYGKGS